MPTQVPPVAPPEIVLPTWILALLGVALSIICLGSFLWLAGVARASLERLIAAIIRRKVHKHTKGKGS